MQLDFLKPALWKAKRRRISLSKKRRHSIPDLTRLEGRTKKNQQQQHQEFPPIIKQVLYSNERPENELDNKQSSSCSQRTEKDDDAATEEDKPPPTKNHRSTKIKQKENNQTIKKDESAGDSAKESDVPTEQVDKEDNNEHDSNEQQKNTDVLAMKIDGEIEEWKARTEELKARLDNANHEIASMKSQLQTAQSIITDLLKVMSEKEDELQRTREELGRITEELCKSTKKLTLAEAGISRKDQTLHNKTEEVRYQRDQVANLEKKLLEKGDMEDLPSTCGTRTQAQQIVGTIRNVLEGVSKSMKTNSQKSKYFFKIFSEMCLDPTIHGGQLKKCAYKVFRKYVHTNMFSADRVLRNMDLQGGVINFEGIELLQEVETGGKPYMPTLLLLQGSYKRWHLL
ncbi:hypothetical protein ACA910_001574 [Epithemia clementina (nom. ined.)]